MSVQRSTKRLNWVSVAQGVITTAASAALIAIGITYNLARDNAARIEYHEQIDEVRSDDTERRLHALENRVAPEVGYTQSDARADKAEIRQEFHRELERRISELKEANK